MDINKIFGAFNSDKEDDGIEFPTPNFVKEMINENHPRYYIGMFSKLINNHLSYQKGLIEMFKVADPSLDIKDVESAGENLLYSKAWNYIKKFDIKDKYSQEILIDISNKPILLKNLKNALSLSISYFEKSEEYEKCAFLKKLLDFLNLSS